jgi:predicted permease
VLYTLAHAWQSWKSARSIALLAVIAFAVGIGATTAIFTFVNGVLLKALPYPDGDRFVTLFAGVRTEPDRFGANTFSDLLEYQRRTTSFDMFGWFRLANFNLTAPGAPQYINGLAVTPSLVHNLGVNPIAGRWFTDETGAVISNTLWRRLGADANIVGQTLTLSERTLTITGVMPPGFRLPIRLLGAEYPSEVWVHLDPLGKGEPPGQGLYFVYARRKPGISFAVAEADVRRAGDDIARLDPAAHPSYYAILRDLRETTFTDLRSPLLLLFGAAGLLLLISCANVATLLLARSVARARETAIRVALGASRRRLAFQYFIEGLYVSTAGAAAGILLSIGLVRLAASAAAGYLPRADEMAIDWKVLSFGLGLAFLTSALSSLAPLWQAIRTAPNDVLTEGVRASAGAGIRKLSRALVVSEIALAFTLLAVSAILIVHLRNLTRVATGFDPDHVLTFQLTLPDAVRLSPRRVPYQTSLVEALEAIPSVSRAGFANDLPLDGCCSGGTVHPEGGSSTPDVGTRRVSFMFVSHGYFQAMGIRLRRGRFLNESDMNPSEQLLLVVASQAAVNRYWPSRDPIGAYGRLNGPDGTRFQVVGVAEDVRNDGLDKPAEAEIYLPSTIFPSNPMQVMVRSPLPAEQLIPEIRRAVQQVDSTLPVHDPKPINAIVGESLQLRRVTSLMMTGFGGAALLMATLGIFGVVSYSVRQRTVEMGTRLAVGAVGRDLLTLVVGDGLKMAAFGVAIGGIAVIGAAWLLVRFLAVEDLGWIPFAASTVIVSSVAGAASFFPAWRATRLSPMVAIRNEPGSTWQSARQTVQRAMQGISRAVSRTEDAPGVSEITLLTDFVAAVRRADSSAEALRMALTTLCERLGAESAMLLEKAGQEYRCTAAAPESTPSNESLPADGFLLRQLKAYPFPLPITSGDLDAWIRWAEEHASGYMAELRTLGRIHARIAVPLRTRTEVLGVILLGPSARPQAYGPGDRAVLQNCADQFALTIENARLTGRVVEQEKLRRDLALAGEIQRGLLPDHPPDAAAVTLAAVSLPARTIGGDYYDFLQIGDHQLAIALADVSGKGVAAALIMSVVHASLRSSPTRSASRCRIWRRR